MRILDAPRNPSSQLKFKCFCILSRLEMLPELRPWLEQAYFYHDCDPELQLSAGAYRVVWALVALGAPLMALLDILGPGPSSAVEPLASEAASLTLNVQRSLFTSFILRVQSLEVQGKILYGEVLRLDDLLGRTCSGFSKILRTIERVLVALEDSFPGLYVIPNAQQAEQHVLVQHLLDSERTHKCILDTMIDVATWLFDKVDECATPLECLIVNLSRFLVYHQYLIDNLETYLLQSGNGAWDEIFAVDTPIFSKVVAAYKSCCSDYIRLCQLPEGGAFVHDLWQGAPLHDTLSLVLSYVCDYPNTLQHLLRSINPLESPIPFLGLCKSIHAFSLLSDDLDEIGRAVRTMHATSTLRQRAFQWNGLDPGDLGALLLDDQLFVSSTGEQLAVFFFEKMLLCCRQRRESNECTIITPGIYPIASWEMGPGLRKSAPLDLHHAIPPSNLRALRCFENDSFELDWRDNNGDVTKSLIFCRLTTAQCAQWCSIIRPMVNAYYRAPELDFVNCTGELASSGQDISPRILGRCTRPRSWSVIGRKGVHSETSSFVVQEGLNGSEYPLSPSLLPTLFRSSASDGPLSPRSNKSSSHLHPSDASFKVISFNVPVRASLSNPELYESNLPDLTGQIVREENYPSAGGGFADVWKGVWEKGPRPEDQVKVAIKALRSRVGDTEREERLKRLFHRELNLWRSLDHKHVIRLLGTASDFGHYEAMVCPWFEHGSVSRYLEKHGDLLSMVDRLQLLKQVASGLSYLHSFNIVHGDLTGSNILINDNKEACLCDFGLSSIAAEFQDPTSTNSTSVVGGSVRWADPQLVLSTSDEADFFSPMLTTSNDIYSFGSVMLEILSGRIPYHYIPKEARVILELHQGKKPRRPADSFVTDAQWHFIQRCWGDEVDERPTIEEVCVALDEFYNSSLDYRRFTTAGTKSGPCVEPNTRPKSSYA